MIQMLFLFNETLSSLILILSSFALVSLLFLCFIIPYKFVLYSTDLLLCFIYLCHCGIHLRLLLSYSILNIVLILLLSLKEQNLYFSTTPASILIIVILNAGSDILFVSMLSSWLSFLPVLSFGVNSFVLTF